MYLIRYQIIHNYVKKIYNQHELVTK